MSKTWFITGASRGFGKQFAKAALGRGDRVAATARSTSDLKDLVDEFGDRVLALGLDVTDRDSAFAVVRRAVDTLGGLDVVVNNAGYGLFGAIEELTEKQLRDQLEVNLFGVFHVTQAVIPILRTQGSGHIIQISSVGGIGAFPLLGGYHASKWALEGLSESLSQELAGTGIRVTLVEPGGFATDWAGSSAVHASPQSSYDHLREAFGVQSVHAEMGDPAAAGPALMQIVDAEEPPLRVLFGSQPIEIVKYLYAQRLQTWAQWESVSHAAQG